MRYGIPHSGPMDRSLFNVLAAALGVKTDFSAIEISTVAGLKITCTKGIVTAGFVGGGFSTVHIDNEKLAPWSIFTLKAGNTLSIQPGSSGSWGYLGFCGELQSEQWLGSRANLLTSGLCGRPLTSGDQFVVDNTALKSALNRDLSIPSFTRFRGVIRAVLGPQDRFFSSETIALLQNSAYRISTEFDRMGVRLHGEKLQIESDLTMLSEALLRGAVQIPGHGDPIVLLADHQTTGGYPKLATVIAPDFNHLVQLRPGDPLQFELLSAEQAVAETRKAHREFLDYIEALATPRKG